MTFFLRNLELILTGIGVILTFLAPSIAYQYGSDWWQIAAFTALTVGIIHGLIFWMVRRRQRQIREAIIADLRLMLKDQLNNRLMALLSEISLQANLADDVELLEPLISHIDQINILLDKLSEESLRSWQSRYAEVMMLPHNLTKS